MSRNSFRRLVFFVQLNILVPYTYRSDDPLAEDDVRRRRQPKKTRQR
jgi:hypothetical protein